MNSYINAKAREDGTKILRSKMVNSLQDIFNRQKHIYMDV